jgi:hypothetical protein
MILLSIIQKELGRVILGALAKIGCWKIGFNSTFFQTHNIGHSTIPRVTNLQALEQSSIENGPNLLNPREECCP